MIQSVNFNNFLLIHPLLICHRNRKSSEIDADTEAEADADADADTLPIFIEFFDFNFDLEVAPARVLKTNKNNKAKPRRNEKFACISFIRTNSCYPTTTHTHTHISVQVED